MVQDRGENVSESQPSSSSFENPGSSIKSVQSVEFSVTPALLVTPTSTSTGPLPKSLPRVPDLPGLMNSKNYQSYMRLTAHPKEPDWIDMISKEFMERHPAYKKPPPDRHGVPIWDTVRKIPSIEELLASGQGVRYSALMLCTFFLMHFLSKSGVTICRGFGGRKSIGRINNGRNFVGRKKYWRRKLKPKPEKTFGYKLVRNLRDRQAPQIYIFAWKVTSHPYLQRKRPTHRWKRELGGRSQVSCLSLTINYCLTQTKPRIGILEERKCIQCSDIV